MTKRNLAGKGNEIKGHDENGEDFPIPVLPIDNSTRE